MTTEPNPYQSPSTKAKSTASSRKRLKYIAHGVYLQLFLGAGMLAIAAFGIDTGPLLDGPQACGGLLIGLGLNSLIYVNRYKQLLN